MEELCNIFNTSQAMAPHSRTKISAQPEAPAPFSLKEEMFDNVSNPSKDQDKDTPVPAKSRYYLVLKDELKVVSSTFNINYQYC
jgi:hypothetical protein